MEDLVREDIDIGTEDKTVSITLFCTMARDGDDGDFDYTPYVDEAGQIVLVPNYEWSSFIRAEKEPYEDDAPVNENTKYFTVTIVAHMISDTDDFGWFATVDELGNLVITPDSDDATFISASIEGDLNVAEEMPEEEPLTEGTWSLPTTLTAVRKLRKILYAPITTKNSAEVKKELYGVFGDDTVYDIIDGLEEGEDARANIKEYIATFLTNNKKSFPDKVFKEMAKLVNIPLNEGKNECFIAVIHIDDEDGTWCKVEAPTQEQAADYILKIMSEKHPEASHIRVDVDDVVRILGESILIEDDELETPEQEFSSAKTSINSSKLPAIFGMVDFKPDTLNLDYGGGKFDNAVEALSEKGVTNVIYDPYNRTAEHNSEVLKQVRQNGGADTITCSNVLNVIKEEEVRMSVLRNMKSLLKSDGTVYITVYEGAGDGVGKETSSGYQLNIMARMAAITDSI